MMVYYLKVNRQDQYAYNNLRAWLNAIYYDSEHMIYILCDKDELIENIINMEGINKFHIQYIKSDTSEEMLKLVNGFAHEGKWKNAAIAHLSTIFHSRKNGINNYWNIDADDTLFCISAIRLFQAMREIMQYACINHIDMFSLDMWVSRWTDLWTFGVVYCSNDIDWISLLFKHINDEAIKNDQIFNIDRFMGYLKKLGDGDDNEENEKYSIESYYFENLKFIHYTNDFIKRPVAGGLMHYKDGMIFQPLLYSWFDLKDLGKIKIDSKVHKLDIGITDQEATDFLIKYGIEEEALNTQCELEKDRR